MNDGQLQRWLDSLSQVSAQRWGLISFAVLVAVGAPMATMLATGESSQEIMVIVALLALASVVHPDSYTGFLVGIVVVWQWIVVVDDVTSAWVVVLAISLFVFHTLLALMAVVPASAHVDGQLILRWLRRCGLVSAATAAMWLVVAVADTRQPTSSEALTAIGFVVLAGLVVAVQGTIVARNR